MMQKNGTEQPTEANWGDAGSAGVLIFRMMAREEAPAFEVGDTQILG